MKWWEWKNELVERRGIAPRSLQCERSVLLLNYRPSGCVVGRVVSRSRGERSGKRRNRTFSTGFWRPVGRHDSATQSAPRTGIEPVSIHRQWICDASRITRHVFNRSLFFVRAVSFVRVGLVELASAASSAGVEPASAGLEDQRLSVRPRGLVSNLCPRQESNLLHPV